MGQVVGNLSLITNAIPAVIPQLQVPGILMTDFLVNTNVGNTADQQGLRTDPNVNCGYAHPRWVPHDQIVRYGYDTGTPGYETVAYTEVTVAEGVVLDTVKTYPWGFREISLKYPRPKPDIEATAYLAADLEGADNVTTQGIVFFWKRLVDDASKGSTLAFRFGIRDGGTDYLFSLLTGAGQYPTVAISTDGGATFRIANPALRPDGGIASILGNTGQLGTVSVPDPDADPNDPDAAPEKDVQDLVGHYEAIEVLFVNFGVAVFVAGSTTPFVIPIAWQSGDLPVIHSLAFKAVGFRELRLSAHLTKFGCDDSVVSNPVNMGFPPVNPDYRITGLTGAVSRQSGDPWAVVFPAGSQVTVTRPPAVPANSQNQAYLLRIQNPVDGNWQQEDFSHYTAAVTRVAIRSHPIWRGTDPFASVPEELAGFGKGLKEVREQIDLDLNSLTIHHSLAFVLDNFYGGSGQNGDRSGLQGNRLVNLALGYLQPFVPLTQRFLGIAQRYEYIRPSNSQAFVRIYARDQMVQLAGKYEFAPATMDQWNHYAAIAFLAELGGIHPSQMSPYLRIRVATEDGGTLWDNPDGVIDPYSSTGADPDPYFLPTGIGYHPWTPRNRSMSILALMNHVRAGTGHMLFYDAGGFLRYEPWVPPFPGAVSRVFTEGATGVDGLNLTEFWDPVVTSDTSDVRNQVVLLGVDAFSGSWAPILEHRSDFNSINVPGSPNYVSWQAPFVWTDSKFANRAFAAATADRLIRVLRIPEYGCDFETWMQPTVFPIDVIWVQERKSGIANLPLYVTRQTNVYSVIDGAIRMRSQIGARYITQFV